MSAMMAIVINILGWGGRCHVFYQKCHFLIENNKRLQHTAREQYNFKPDAYHRIHGHSLFLQHKVLN